MAREEKRLDAHEGEELSDEEKAKVLGNFEKAGRIAASIIKQVPKLVLPGESYLDIAESLEKMICDAGAKPAFPVNVSVNDIAAHFTPEADSKQLLGERDLVKIDIGVQIEGCIGDTAITVDLSGEHGRLCEASQAALEAAIASIKPGVPTGRIGAEIEKQMSARGYKPVENLTGHKIEPYILHAGEEIPNIPSSGGYELAEGDIFAVEPFASAGSGRVADTAQVEIFALQAAPKLRMKYSRELLSHIAENYLSLPFAERWLKGVFNSRITLNSALRELLNSGALRPYPVLRDTGRGLVSQAEHTIIVEHDSARILTKE
ncbi:MAG: type II methionyl aminopeptidase [Candidatus Micrarchaeota archaeon]|nr:type II methionyl aminopeptidase [Candidatus Micrarchaeota archaeon]